MANPAHLDDLAARWYPNPLDDESAATMAQVRLDIVWRALQAELPSLTTRLSSSPALLDSVIDVVCDATLRVLRNPEGYTKGSASVDDASESWEADASSLSNDVYFTAAELRRLSGRSSGAFTIRPA